MSLLAVGSDENGTVFLDTDTGGFVYADGSPASDPNLPKDEDPKDTTFDPSGLSGSSNVKFFEDSVDDSSSLINFTERIIRDQLIEIGKVNGIGDDQMLQFFYSHWNSTGVAPIIDGILRAGESQREETLLLAQQGIIPIEAVGDFPGTSGQGSDWYAQTIEGFNDFVSQVWDFYNTKAPIDLGAFGGTSVPRGGGGGGRRSATPAEIRKQFDLDELANAAKTIWQSMLLTNPDDARGMAKAYVDAIVATKGEQKIDFQTFIEKRARDTGRYASIYADLPDGMSESQYLTPFYQAALQVTRPENAAGVAIGGAQFGADPSTFGARLRRTEEFTSSAPFINEMEGRLRDINNLFQGS